MDQDNPEYLVFELFAQNFWKDHAIGKPILGTRQTVKSFSREKLLSHFREWYAPSSIVLTAAGHIEHKRLVELAAEAFSGRKPIPNGSNGQPPETHAALLTRTKRELEQVHICIGVPAPPIDHAQRFSAALLNLILGGGMSSRLFQNIRERQGLAYAIFSELTPYSDTGMLSVYAGTALETAGRVVECVVQEFRELKEKPVPEEELRRAKDHLKGSLMLSLESTSARMSNLARNELYFGRFFTLDEIVNAVEAVTREELLELARQLFAPDKIGATVLGNLDGFRLTREMLAC
jgi:predicted Zn-dependent peptidase